MNQKRLLFIVLCLVPLSGISIDLYVPSLPAIAKHFVVMKNLSQLTITTYLITYALGQLIMGTLSDIYGRRNILLASLFIFIIASLLAANSMTIGALLIWRAAQGLSVAGPACISKALLSDRFGKKELLKATIYLNTIWGLGPIIAPALGGYIQHYFGWQMNFYVLMGIGFFVLLIIFFFLEETNIHRIDFDLKIILKNYKTVLSNIQFMSSVTCLGFNFSILIVYNVIAPFLIQTKLGYSAITYGHLALFVGSSILLSSLINRILIHNFTIQQICSASYIAEITIALVILVLLFFVPTSLGTIVVPTLILLIVSKFINLNLLANILKLHPKMAGTASAMIGTTVMLMAGILSAISSQFHAKNQWPMAWLYLSITILGGILYFSVIRRTHSSDKAD